MIGWIVVELAFIREINFLHPLFLVIGVVLTSIGFSRGIERRAAASRTDRLGNPRQPAGKRAPGRG